MTGMSKFMILLVLLALLCFGHCVYLACVGQFGYIPAFFLCGLANTILAREKWQEIRKHKALARIIEKRY